MILKGFFSLIRVLWQLLKLPLCIILGFLVGVFIAIMISFLRHRKEFKNRSKSDYRPLKKSSFFRKIFIEAPEQYISDLVNRPPNYFPVHGLIIFEGRQGSGKTSSMVHYIHELQSQYPNLKVITNFSYDFEDHKLRHWKQLIKYVNGFEGVCVGIDELQNWFSSKQSKDFPPEMLSVVTQNRKNRRVILGTAQNFYMVSKDIRSQCTEVRRCFTIAGVFTIVRRLEPIVDSQGNLIKFRHIGWYTWVHNHKLRSSYDTYKAIDSLADSGFTERKNLSFVSNTIVSKRKR